MERPSRFEHSRFLGDKRTQLVYHLDTWAEPAVIDEIVAHFDPGTQRAILRLYRSSPEDVLAAAGADLAPVRCPAIVVWGDGDPYTGPAFADAYAAALGGPAAVRHVAGAGHWPWIERPELIGEIAAFLDDDGVGD